jgi:flavin-dependent dehydrogenase
MRRFDIIILGVGPAGAVSAINLQKMGYNVALLGEIRRRAAYEGIAPRTLEGLRRAGLENAQMVATTEALRTASWNGVTTAANREYLVNRLTFDKALLEDCRAAKIPLIPGRIGAVQPLGKGWCTSLATASGAEKIYGDFLVEARGRRAPGRGQIARRGPATLALTQKYSGAPPGRPEACVTSYRDGWCWLALLGSGEAIVQIIISGRRTDLAGKANLAALFASEIKKLPDIRARLGAARPQGPVTAREASARQFSDLAKNNHLRVGDAAFAIDPLSGHGNFEAIGGAMAAAAVINTILKRPENQDLAISFYDERATGAFLRHARVGRDFYRQETRWPDAPFWRERRDWPDNLPAHESALSDAPRIISAPVIENGFIARRDIIITASEPRGIRTVDGVPLAELLAAAMKAGPEMSPEAVARQFNATPGQIKTALKWLEYHKLLNRQDSRRSAP